MDFTLQNRVSAYRVMIAALLERQFCATLSTSARRIPCYSLEQGLKSAEQATVTARTDDLITIMRASYSDAAIAAEGERDYSVDVGAVRAQLDF